MSSPKLIKLKRVKCRDENTEKDNSIAVPEQSLILP
jgi:hypothetical protein